MNANDPNIRWRIPIEEIWDYFKENKDSLSDRMEIICESAFDDADKKWWLFMTTDDEEPLFLSLENSEIIIDSEVISGSDEIKEAIKGLLAEI